MIRFFFVALACMIGMNIKAQDALNMELLSNLTYNERLSDVWAYAAPNGDEYAIVGTNTTTSIVSLVDPRNPEEVASFPGASSIWRDMKHFGEFVYVTTDRGIDGLLVIDMSGAPNNITAEFWTPDIVIDGDTTRLEACHNIFIDDEGFGYLAGCNMNSGAPLIIDLFTTPGSPSFVGPASDTESHDVMAQNNLLYSSEIREGRFSVYDVSDKEAPSLLASQFTTFAFTHNAWASDDGNFLFTTDERGNAFVDSYDISDLTDIQRLDSWQPEASKGLGSIPHNTHYFNGFLVTSWYSDGVRIIDGNKPDNLVEVAFFDTFPEDEVGFIGVWGATPYLPSGLVLASDIFSGLYVFEADYRRASYLEGNVIDANTSLPIGEVNVTLESEQLNSEITNVFGDYKTGLVEEGQVMVTFEISGYQSQTLSATLQSGELTELNVALVPESSTSTRELITTQIFTSTPNPFNHSTLLDFNEAVSGQLLVNNILGQLVETIDLENTKQVELGRKYDAGVYLVSLSSADKRYEGVKIVKQ